MMSCSDDDENNTPTQQQKEEGRNSQGGGAQGVCCFYLRYGKCDPPRGHCRFRHDIHEDDGVTPRCFGATCRLGHASRALSKDSKANVRMQYWKNFNTDDAMKGDSPALRDATLLRSQLEPWPTAVLRDRLVTLFGESYAELDGLGRGEMMRRLLVHYEARGPRKVIKVKGTPIPPGLQKELLERS